MSERFVPVADADLARHRADAAFAVVIRELRGILRYIKWARRRYPSA